MAGHLSHSWSAFNPITGTKLDAPNCTTCGAVSGSPLGVSACALPAQGKKALLLPPTHSHHFSSALILIVLSLESPAIHPSSSAFISRRFLRMYQPVCSCSAVSVDQLYYLRVSPDNAVYYLVDHLQLRQAGKIPS
jgi:hypothetical protein